MKSSTHLVIISKILNIFLSIKKNIKRDNWVVLSHIQIKHVKKKN